MNSVNSNKLDTALHAVDITHQKLPTWDESESGASSEAFRRNVALR